MAEQRRPSGQSLVLDLEGLDLGGPAADLAHSNTRLSKAAAHRRTQPSSISSFSDIERPSGPTIASHTRLDSREADSFATHLREECLDSQEIYSSETMLTADAAASDGISPHTLHASDPHAWQSARRVRQREPTPHASPHLKAQPDISHQVLGGFASLGLSHLPGSSKHLPALNTRESLAPSLTSEFAPTRWTSLHCQSCDPMDVLDILSIEEMGQLAINMGSRDDWDGLLLSSSDAAPSNSSSESAVVLEGAAVAAWMTARSVKGKRKWICTPAISSHAAARTIVVTDRGLITGSNTDTRPHAAFSGLASFELRFLRDQDASQAIILAPARALRPHFSHLTHGPGRRRRAESLTRSQLPSPRRNPSERPSSSRDEPVLRRTRSRPAIKIGSLDRREETARPERFLIDSLAEAGLLMGASIPSTPVSPCTALQSIAVNASESPSVAKTDSQPTTSTLGSNSSTGSNSANNQIEHTYPGEAIYPFKDFNFGNAPVCLTSTSLDPSPQSPGCVLGPAHQGDVVSADPSLSTRPFLLQTVSDRPLPRDLDDSIRGNASEISDSQTTKLTRGTESGSPSPSRVRKEGSKLTGWLKKRITGSIAAGGPALGPGNTRRADSSTRSQRPATDKLHSSLSPTSSDVIECSSDVTHDDLSLAALPRATMVPPNRSHGTVCDPLRPPQGRDCPPKGNLVGKDLMFRRASVSDDQLATMQGQEARKAALGASVGRRLPKDVSGPRAPRHSVAVIHPSKESRGRGMGQLWPSVSENHSLQMVPDGAQENGLAQAAGSEDIPSLNTSRPGSSATTTSSNEDPLGLNDALPEALIMVLPLPFRRRGAGAGTVPSLYLRLAFVPFEPRGNLSPETSTHSFAKEAPSMPAKSAANTKQHAGPGAGAHWYQRFGRSFAEPSSTGPLSLSRQEAMDRLASASKEPEALLFGAGPARRGEGKVASVTLNRRTSYVQAFRVTGQVVDASPKGMTNGASPGLPPAGSFPVVLAVCMEEQSLEFMPEGWAALCLQGGPSDAEDDAMFGVADAIVAACAAIMDL